MRNIRKGKDFELTHVQVKDFFLAQIGAGVDCGIEVALPRADMPCVDATNKGSGVQPCLELPNQL